jgi:hypothetical protein
VAVGKPADVIPAYHAIVRRKLDHVKDDAVHERPAVGEVPVAPKDFKRFGTKDVEITGVCFLDGQGQPISEPIVEPNGRLAVRITFNAHKRVLRPVFGIAIHRSDGVEINGSNSRASNVEIDYIEGNGTVEYTVDRLPLLPGKFYFTASVSDYDVFIPYDIWLKCLSFSVGQSNTVKDRIGILYLDSRWTLVRN